MEILKGVRFEIALAPRICDTSSHRCVTGVLAILTRIVGSSSRKSAHQGPAALTLFQARVDRFLDRPVTAKFVLQVFRPPHAVVAACRVVPGPFDNGELYGLARCKRQAVLYFTERMPERVPALSILQDL